MFELTHKSYLRILDFDVECRPMSWYGGDWVTKEVTAIAWKFLDEDIAHHWLLLPSRTWEAHQKKKLAGLKRFIKAYNAADMVTGHYIRGFDLPLLNGTCIRLGVDPLGPKLTHDTKGDLITMQGLSKSQENLASLFEEMHPKIGMNVGKWEVGNSLVLEGREETKKRVIGDVEQHEEFRLELIRRKALQRPKMWTPSSKGSKYAG